MPTSCITLTFDPVMVASPTRKSGVSWTLDVFLIILLSSFGALLGHQHVFRQHQSRSGMRCAGSGLYEGCGIFAGKEGYSSVGVDKAVNRMHYLRSALSASLSPLGGERVGRSYLRKADNP